jgi:hypothetical protein
MAIFLGNSNGGPGGGGGSYTAGDGITIVSNVISFGGTVAGSSTLNLNNSASFNLTDAATGLNGFYFQPTNFEISYANAGISSAALFSDGTHIGLNAQNSSNQSSQLDCQPNFIVISYADPGGQKSLRCSATNNKTGIGVYDDIDQLGLNGYQDFSANAIGQNLAYAQVTTVKQLISQNTVTPNVYSIDTPGQTSTQTIGSITVSNPAIYRVNVYGLWRSGLGSVDIQINYTNLDSIPTTIDLGSVAVGNENLNSPAYVIKSVGGGAVIEVVATLTGAGIYDCGLTIELLF